MDSLDELKLKIKKFNEARDWDKFHTPTNLAKSIVIEAAELLECFQWSDEYKLDEVKDELADVLIYTIALADKLNLNIPEIVNKKMLKNAKNYPISKAKGNALKKTELKTVSKEVVKAETKKETKVVAKKETKVVKKEEKKIGTSAYDSKYDKKFYFDLLKKTILRNDKKYSDYTKNKLIDEIISYYDNNDVIPYILSEEELLFLKVNKSKVVSSSLSSYQYLLDLMLFTEKDNKASITTELYNVLATDIANYTKNKAEIEEKKENAYLLVGIMRVFGALTSDEMNKILSKYAKEEIGDFYSLPYALRHIDYKDEYGVSYFVLRNLGLDEISLIESRKDNLKCPYSKKELIGIGKAYFNVYSNEYKAVAKNNKALVLLNKIDKEELIRAALKDEELKVFAMDFYSSKDMEDKDRNNIMNLFKSLPRIKA